ncbi:MAG: flavin reductase family protein [Candidatus Micrarchaeota archaeon]|nr:flavin reductase family protein [Candidatus Micrarchaeota archaeon]
MNLAWGDSRTNPFITNVGLVTSNGSYGENVMSAEWTHYVSYAPAYIVVNIKPIAATADNIIESKEFGVSLASINQNVFASVAGMNSGKNVDKIAALKELGFEFYAAKKINAPMVKNAAMNAECKLVKYEPLGDRFMFVGEIVEITASETDESLAYHDGKYYELGKNIRKSSEEEFVRISEVVKKHTR